MGALWKTKTFWVGLATLATGVAALVTTVDVSAISWTVNGLWSFAQTVAGADGWTTVLLGFAIITGRHALAKMTTK